MARIKSFQKWRGESESHYRVRIKRVMEREAKRNAESIAWRERRVKEETMKENGLRRMELYGNPFYSPSTHPENGVWGDVVYENVCSDISLERAVPVPPLELPVVAEKEVSDFDSDVVFVCRRMVLGSHNYPIVIEDSDSDSDVEIISVKLGNKK